VESRDYDEVSEGTTNHSEELLDGKKMDAPPMQDVRTFKKAPRATTKRTHKQTKLTDDIDLGDLDFPPELEIPDDD